MVPVVLHNFRVSRIAGDFFLNDIFPDGVGGTPVFGRFAALLQAAILSHARWMLFQPRSSPSRWCLLDSFSGPAFLLGLSQKQA